MTIVDWGKGPLKLSWIDATAEIDVNKVTSVHGYFFNNGNVLVVNNKNRGVELPGGHVEFNESLVESLHREVNEEACVKLSEPQLLGYIEADNTINPNFPDNCPYPLIGYLAFYVADVAEFLPFKSEFETCDRFFVSPKNLMTEHYAWNSVLQQSLESVLRIKEIRA